MHPTPGTVALDQKVVIIPWCRVPGREILVGLVQKHNGELVVLDASIRAKGKLCIAQAVQLNTRPIKEPVTDADVVALDLKINDADVEHQSQTLTDPDKFTNVHWNSEFSVVIDPAGLHAVKFITARDAVRNTSDAMTLAALAVFMVNMQP